ncbi:c-type cytochrome [Brevifollis gellanilyticus]|uniref:c-type cytochrome n=1 Tax=Brevifollis gellanilyticus TaxID=748831 RepID=UPI0011BF65D8|nr:c-type cytochrome [Brevifollis gellanilyticus]
MRLQSVFLLLALLAQPVIADEQGTILFKNVCANCHGEKGEGKIEVKSPSIANEPAWYVKTQLQNFHDGKRGFNTAADPQGALMASIAKVLTSEQIEAVAKHVESLALVPPKEREIAGADVQRGQQLFYERCMECHRYNASGEMLFGSPPLVGRQGWYLVAQLKKFKGLHRGSMKGDEKGAKMVNMATLFIEDEQMMKNVVGYILTLNPPVEESGQKVADELFQPKAEAGK